MNPLKRILPSFRFNHTLCSSASELQKNIIGCSHRPHIFPNIQTLAAVVDLRILHQRHFSSSSPLSFLELFSSEDWCMKLDKELQESNLALTHETVIYILKNLSNSPEKASRFYRLAVDEKGFQSSSSIDSLMLRIYASKNFMKEFWVTIKEMKEKGSYLDEETYKTVFATFRELKMENEATALRHFYARLLKENAMEDVVKDVVEVIKSSDCGEQVDMKLGAMKIVVSDNFLLRVLKELRGIGYPLKAYRFFKWVEKYLGFKHNNITYNGLLRILCWEESMDEFWSIMEEMKNAGLEMDLDTYIKVTRRLQKNRMLKDAVKLYEHMMDSPFNPSFKECNMLLHTIARQFSPDLDLVFKVVNKFEAAGHLMSKSVYDGIHRSLTSVGKFHEAEKIVETMRNAGYGPDNITYSQLVFGLCKARMFEEANAVIDKMVEQGCTPDIKTWSILIKGHCVANEVDKAMLCFAKMMETNLEADSDLLDMLVNGFLSQGRVIGAYMLLLELVKKFPSRPWQATYKNLIQKLLGERKFEEALGLLRQMKKKNHPPFPEPFIKYISKFGSVEDAHEFLMTLSVKEFPSVSAYQRVFKSFFDEGRHSEAKDLLFKCPHHIRKHASVCSLFGTTTQ